MPFSLSFAMTDVDTNLNYRFAMLPTADFLLSVKDMPAVEAAELAGSNRDIPLAVIDTNVWLDLYFWNDAGVESLKALIDAKRISVCTSLECLEELADVIHRPQFKLTVEKQHDLLKQVLSVCKLVVQPTDVTVKCRDGDDQKFLNLAHALKADFLVTKDKLVLKAGKKLKKFGTIVTTPSNFSLSQAAS